MNRADLESLLAEAGRLPRATTVLRESGLRVLLLNLHPGEEIPEHQTRGAITVQCLKGRAVFSQGAEQVNLRAHSIISLGPAAPHSVKADEDTLLLVTVSEPNGEKS